VTFLQLSFVIFVGEELTVFGYVVEECEKNFKNRWSRLAMSNPKCLLSQKLCHYLNQGHTLNNILLRRPRIECMTYFHLSKLNFA